jgi:uncharacterized protein involved in exopolysaccharide biosynthesis
MLQSYSAQGQVFYEGGGQSLGLGPLWGILKRRGLYGVVAFSLILLIGAFFTAIQRPIYEARGKVLVESQEIPTDLVRPTVSQTANERIQVIEQRIMTRDNLLALVNKYKMFAREQQWMSASDILDLMRDRTEFELVDINSTPGRPGASSTSGRPGTSTIAFTIKFQYENPDIATRVANDILTLMLSEDARNRTNSATETTAFLTRESQRLQGELAAIEAQIAENRTKSADPTSPTTDPSRLQIIELTKLKEELVQGSSTYSAEHPRIKALKKRIAAMEELIAQTPSAAVAQVNSGLFELQRQEAATQKSLEDTNKKLEEARLGEKLERDQQSERLQVIEQPVQPQTPIKPNKIKLLALSLGLAMAAGVGAIFGREMLDKSIRSSRELLGVTNGRMIVSIPYIATRAETVRRRSRFWLSVGILLILLVAGVAGFVFFGPPIDPSWIRQFTLDRLTGLTK